jgi:hypothetical protein
VVHLGSFLLAIVAFHYASGAAPQPLKAFAPRPPPLKGGVAFGRALLAVLAETHHFEAWSVSVVNVKQIDPPPPRGFLIPMHHRKRVKVKKRGSTQRKGNNQ